MGYHPRIETSNVASFQTTRCRNSELWFVNNKALEATVLGHLTKFSIRYGVELYAFAIEGNHTQFPALFPRCNRSHFMRDLNSCIARAVPRHTARYPGGRFWQRRYSAEFLPDSEDIEEYFFYTVLQPVQDGHVDKISQYPGYNCFHDAVFGVSKTFKVVNWAAYHEKKRWSEEVNIKDYIEEVKLTYKRLPGYEKLSQKEYAELMHERLEKRRLAIIEKRHDPAGRVRDGRHLKLVKPGDRPKKTKTSTITTHRPRILTRSSERRAVWLKWYFERYSEYKNISKRYRDGEQDVIFPAGMYKPPRFTVVYSVSIQT